MFSIKFLGGALCCALISSGAYGEIYKWVNEKGETVYSEKKPQNPKTNIQEIKPRNSKPYIPAPEDDVPEEKQAEAEPKVEERVMEDPEQKKQNEKIRKENCEIAKAKFTRLQRPRINDVSADGTRTRIGEDARQSQIKEAAAAKLKWCS